MSKGVWMADEPWVHWTPPPPAEDLSLAEVLKIERDLARRIRESHEGLDHEEASHPH